MHNYARQLFGIMFHSKQTQQIVHPQQQHTSKSPVEWRQYWQAKGFPWRTEPEIDAKRQEELSKRRTIVPDIEKGLYPFKGMKLSRSDVEWLLVTHENGRGPVDWSDESQHRRKGLDVRGADLSQVDLHHLPLARIQGGLPLEQWTRATEKQRNMAVVHMENALLKWAHLEGAYLRGAHLERASFFRAHLQDAHLDEAHLENAFLNETHLGIVILTEATLSDKKCVGPHMVDVYWGSTNLAVIKWSQMKMLGEEYDARQKHRNGKMKSRAAHLKEFETAVRANRQLAVALQNQGLNEDAARFTYRALILQRKVWWKQHNFWKWLGSAILALLAGYGYRMWRILTAYAIIISLCAVACFIIGIYHAPHLTLLQAFLESITAFHGRVFYELFTTETPQIWVTAFEAVVGLVIEGVFIAMLTQRFFGK